MSRTSLALLLPLALAACSRGRAGVAPVHDAVAVRLAPVTIERIARPVSATGVLGPKEEVPLSFKVGGVIGRILVDEGQSVRAGDTLAALDLSEIDAGVTRARSAAEKAERDLTRAQRLYNDSVATLEQVQNAQTGRDVAAAELETATFNRRYAVIVAPAAWSDGVSVVLSGRTRHHENRRWVRRRATSKPPAARTPTSPPRSASPPWTASARPARAR